VTRVSTRNAANFTSAYDVVFRAPYALFVETGTSRMAAQPFLMPSLMLHYGPYMSTLRQVLSP
jgi:hypothetical protein